MKKVIILISIIILSGCANKSNVVELHPMIQKEIRSCEAVVPSVQENIIAEIEESRIHAYTGGGLLFGLVDGLIMNYRSNRAENHLKPVNEIFKDFPLKAIMEQKLGATLKGIPWLGCKQLNIFHASQKEDHNKIVKASNKDVVLFLTFEYKFSPTIDTISGTLSVTMFPASTNVCACVKLDDPHNTPIYKKQFMASETLPNPSDNMEQNVQFWVVEDGKIIKETLLKLLNSTVLQLKNQLVIAEEVDGGNGTKP